MSLRVKTALILLVVLAVLVIVHHSTSAIIVRNGFQKAEEQGARMQLDSFSRILAERIDKLATVTGDWAVWDDTYAFMESGDPAYLRSNITPVSFREINVNLACFIDSSGRVANYKGYDLTTGRDLPLPAGLSPYLNPVNSPLFVHPGSLTRPAGIAVLPAGPILLAARPILTSNGLGPARGTLVFGRFLDTVEVARIAGRIQTRLDLFPLAAPDLPAGCRDAAAAIHAGRSASWVTPLDQEQVAGYTLLTDLSGQPALIVRLMIPQTFRGYERRTNTVLFWYFLLACLICFAVTLSLLERTVLHRLAKLGRRVRAVGEAGDPGARVALPGRDEIAGLSRAIDGMLDALQATRKQLGEYESRFRTEKKRAEEALRQSVSDMEARVRERTAELFEINRRLQEEILERTRTGGELTRLRKAVERLPLGVTITDREGKILYTNPAEASMRGCMVEDLIGDDGTVVSPRETDRPETSLQMKAMGVWSRERTCVRKDGSVFHAHLLSSSILNDAEEPIGIVTSCEDITDRKKAEDEIRRLNAELEQRVADRTAQLEAVIFKLKTEISARQKMEGALRKSEENYRNLFKQVPIGLYCSTPAGKITDANPAMVELLGYPDRETFLQTPAVEIWPHPEDRQGWVERMEREDTISGEDVRWRRRNGDEIWVRWNVRIARDETGAVVSFTGAVEDITERKRIQEQLTRAQKMEMLGQFASGIAHDFNNLIMVISGTAELLQRMLPPDDRFHPDLGTILRTARRATELSGSLLAFARKQVLQRQDIDLAALIQDMLPMMQRIIPENIAVQFRSGQAAAPVHADPGQIENAVINLLMNARDAMPAGGEIEVTVGVEELGASYAASRPWVKPGPYAFVTVRDTGVGMSEEVLGHVFEPFFTTKEPGRGTGLGLPMVYGIVKQHEGMVEVSSVPGLGTTFTLYLPKCVGRWEPRRPAAEDKVEGGSERILVVEDQPDLRGLVSRFLQELGYQVHQACNGQQALNMLQSAPQPFDLVLTDLVMPLMSGLELHRQTSPRTPATVFLFTSGYLEEATRSNLAQDPSVGFLAKPYDIGELALKVRALLKNRGRS